MSNLTDEKFVSIEYDTWVNKYQRLEKDNFGLKRELEEEKRKKQGVLYVKISSRMNVYPRDEYGIGTIDFTIEDAPSISIDRRKEFAQMIRKTLDTHDNLRFINRDELYEADRTLGIKKEEIAKKYSELQQKIKQLPRIVRWLFKIKSI